MTKIKKLENQLKQIQEELEKLKKNEEDWKPKMREYYYYVSNTTFEVNEVMYDGDIFDRRIFEHNLIFHTKKEAQEYLEYLLAKEKAMNEFSQEEWENNGLKKYNFYYFYNDKELNIDYWWNARNNCEYFRTEEEARRYINKYKKFILKEIGIKE